MVYSKSVDGWIKVHAGIQGVEIRAGRQIDKIRQNKIRLDWM